MSISITILLALAAFVTSTISGTIGMGGGVLMLAVLLSFLPHSQTIPVHAAVQICSNGTRILVFLRHVDWKTVLRFGIGVLFGAALGTVLLWWLGNLEEGEPYLKMAVGLYVLLSVIIPTKKPAEPTGTERGFAIIGMLAGALALTVGAIGPLIAPLFARYQFEKHRLIATKAVCQMVTHILKIPAFIVVLNVKLGDLAWLTGLMVVMTIPGTLLGRALVGKISQATFMNLYRASLLAAGLKVLAWDGVYALVKS